LGVALGDIGLRYDDFCRLTPDEFGHIYKAYSEKQEARYKDNWERTRMLATFILRPYAKKGLTPHRILPFPWDKERTRKEPPLDKQKVRKRLEKLMYAHIKPDRGLS
jgi:hypothetical protein